MQSIHQLETAVHRNNNAVFSTNNEQITPSASSNFSSSSSGPVDTTIEECLAIIIHYHDGMHRANSINVTKNKYLTYTAAEQVILHPQILTSKL